MESRINRAVFITILTGVLAILLAIEIFFWTTSLNIEGKQKELFVTSDDQFFGQAGKGGANTIRTLGSAGSGSSGDEGDTTAPGTISGLTASSVGTNFITWNWTNPTDSDFDGAIIYLDDVFVEISSGNSYTASGLLPSTTHTITINTIDKNKNINETDISNTQTTNSIPGDTTPPATITNLSVTSKGTNFITWAWTNPTDADFAENIIYINGIEVARTSSASYTAPGLTADTDYIINVHTIDTSGNINSTDVLLTTRTNAIIPGNNPPVANAGIDQAVDENTPVTLDGTASSDADGDALTYLWMQTSGIGVTLSSATAASPTFTAPAVSADSSLTFELVVNDGKVASAADSVTIIVRDVPVIPGNNAPVANNVNINTNEDISVSVPFSCTDIDGDSLTYEIVSNPSNGVLSGTGATRAYTPNSNYNGADSFTYRCYDGNLYSNTAIVSLTINPVDDVTIWLPLANQNVNEDLKDNKDAPVQASRIVYANIASRVSDADGAPAITIVSPHSYYNLAIVGNDLVISNVIPNWPVFENFVSENVVLSANGATANFILTVNKLLDDCISGTPWDTYTVYD